MRYPLFFLLFLFSCQALATGNTQIESFNKAKQILMTQIHVGYNRTLYCDATYDEAKRVTLPPGFVTTKHQSRANKLEWEHVVPAENFGRSFTAWREGHPQCVDSKDKSFKGRKCAEKVVREYRLMQADMYNLFPAIGAVNAMRSNYNFTMLPQTPPSFGSCAMKVENRKAEPPEGARGPIARTYLYMEATYPKFSMSRQTRQLMEAWDKMYPVSQWECDRADRIKDAQGNENPIMASACNGLIAINP